MVRGEFRGADRGPGRGWAAIARGEHTLIHAPTGSGKTLAAFLYALDRLARDPSPPPPSGQPRPRPGPLHLPAQGPDLRRRAQPPRAAHRHRPRRPEARRRAAPTITVASRTGDTPSEDRREIARRAARHPHHDPREPVPPADEPGARDPAQRRARHRRRGPRDRRHEAGRPPRPEPRTPRARSATRDDRAARSGSACPPRNDRSTRSPGSSVASARTARSPIVDAGARKPLELEVIVPVDDMAAIGEVLPQEQQPGGPAISPDLRTSIWPAIHPRILELIRSHRSTIVFTNSRRLSERLAQRLNELAGEDLVRAHHGSIAREQRLEIEEELKAGRLPALVATSSPRARHRHGRRRPRHPGREPDERRPRPPARRPCRPPGRRPEQGRHLPEVPRRPARGRGRHAAHARGRDRGRRGSRATRSTSSPSSSSR